MMHLNLAKALIRRLENESVNQMENRSTCCSTKIQVNLLILTLPFHQSIIVLNQSDAK